MFSDSAAGPFIIRVPREMMKTEAKKPAGGTTMPQITMKALLESGVHFGHQTKRWNPKMKPYIFAARNGIYIIDLQKTLKYTKEASQITQSWGTGKSYSSAQRNRQRRHQRRSHTLRNALHFHTLAGGILPIFPPSKPGLPVLNSLKTWKQPVISTATRKRKNEHVKGNEEAAG